MKMENTEPSSDIRHQKACQQCKARKVRCDGRRGICGNCERLRFNCSFQSSHFSSLKPERLRVRQACNRCHSLKVRCSGHLPSCGRCQKKGRECVYPSHIPDSQPSLELPSLPVASVTHNSSLGQPDLNPSAEHRDGRRKRRRISDPSSLVGPEKNMIQTALELYFNQLYPLPDYAFLHRASLYDRLHHGEVDQCLLLAIIALASCLKESTAFISPEYGTECLQKAEQIILSNLSQPSIIRTQALLLVIRCKMWMGDYCSAFPLVAILTRFAFVLRLNLENSRVCFLAQETRRRLMWAIYTLDTRWAGGLLEFTVCPIDAIHVNLPCREESFELDIRQKTEPLRPVDSQYSESDIGLLAHNVRVSYLRDRVLRHTKSLAAGSSTPQQIIQGITKLEDELDQFYLRISSSEAYSERNLRLRARSPWLPRFIVLHITWHQCYCDLYRCVSSGLEESISSSTLREIDGPFISACLSRCMMHATSIAKIITCVLDLGIDSPVLPLEIAIYAYQCMRLIFHLLKAHPQRYNISPEVVHNHSDSCRKIVRQLARLSPSIRRIESDLEGLILDGMRHLSTPQYLPSPQSITQESSSSTSRSTPRQILSIHSMINHSQVVDDSDKLILPPEPRGFISPTTTPVLPSPLVSSTVHSDDLRSEQRLSDEGWINPNSNNAFEGAWDGPEIGFDILRPSQGQWDGVALWGLQM